MTIISSHAQCCECDWVGKTSALTTATVFDDRDQMWGRPLGGTMDILVCPECGSEEIDDWYTDESEED